MVGIVVQKYGGSSLADLDKIKAVAARIAATRKAGYDVVVVVSAMGKTTDGLLAQAKELSASPAARELDMLLSAGERISMSLMSLAIQALGFQAVSLTGSQSGIITSDSHSNARIIDVRPVRVLDELARGNIVIVAGFQVMSYKREITTLGRGGSDTTAVALAAALGARWCEICSDVEGAFSADPRVVPEARLIREIGYDEMEALGEAGAKVLNPDAIEFARHKGLRVMLTSTFTHDPLTGAHGTLLLQRVSGEGEGLVRAVTSTDRLLRVRIPAQDAAKRGRLLERLAAEKLPAPFYIEAGGRGRVVLHLDRANLHDWTDSAARLKADFPDIEIMENEAAVSLIGPRMDEDAGTVAAVLRILAESDMECLWVKTSRESLTVGIPAGKVTEGVRVLHKAFVETAPTSENVELRFIENAEKTEV